MPVTLLDAPLASSRAPASARRYTSDCWLRTVFRRITPAVSIMNTVDSAIAVTVPALE